MKHHQNKTHLFANQSDIYNMILERTNERLSAFTYKYILDQKKSQFIINIMCITFDSNTKLSVPCMKNEWKRNGSKRSQNVYQSEETHDPRPVSSAVGPSRP